MGMLAPDHSELYESLSPYLEPDERLSDWAYGVQQFLPLVLGTVCLTSLPAAVLTQMLVGPRGGLIGGVIFFTTWGLTLMLPMSLVRKDYVMGLTDRRFLIVRLKTPLLRLDPRARLEFRAYALDQLPKIDVTNGWLRMRLRINDGSARLRIDVGRRGMAGNHDAATTIVAAVTRRASAAGHP
jgi:hypothetical protein